MPARPPAPRAARPTVVLVCADPVVLRRRRSALRGCDVETWCDPFGALGRLRAGPTPDLVLVDVALPGTSGPELLSDLSAPVRERTLLVGALPPGTWTADIEERVIDADPALLARLPALLGPVQAA